MKLLGIGLGFWEPNSLLESLRPSEENQPKLWSGNSTTSIRMNVGEELAWSGMQLQQTDSEGLSTLQGTVISACLPGEQRE